MASLHLPRIHTDTQRPSVVLKTAPLEVLRGEPRRRIEGGEEWGLDHVIPKKALREVTVYRGGTVASNICFGRLPSSSGR